MSAETELQKIVAARDALLAAEVSSCTCTPQELVRNEGCDCGQAARSEKAEQNLLATIRKLKV